MTKVKNKVKVVVSSSTSTWSAPLGCSTDGRGAPYA
jgi:hypothetical protein